MTHSFEAELCVRGRERNYILPRVRPGDCTSAFVRLDYLRLIGAVGPDDIASAAAVLEAIARIGHAEEQATDMTDTIECRDLTALLNELRDIEAALRQHDDPTLCLKIMLMAASRRAETAARKREDGR